jgi:hypothetical protein
MKTKIIATFFLFLLLVMLVPLATNAQEVIDFSAVEVDLWPEYDRPEMLVIYRIALAPGVSLPAEVTVRIPAAAGLPNAVASGQPDGSLLNLIYDQQPAGEWSDLKFTAISSIIQIEYYDPDLVKDGTARHFEYRWAGDHPVAKMTVQVQQPGDATDMRISPNLGSGVQGGDGLVYYTADVGSLDIGQTFAIVIDYLKATDALSTSELGVQSSAPIETTMPSRVAWESVLPYLLGALGLVLIVGGGFWYWQTGKNKRSTKSRPSRHKPVREGRAADTDSVHIYCHQCGKRAQKGDRFCRICGSQLRTGS